MLPSAPLRMLPHGAAVHVVDGLRQRAGGDDAAARRAEAVRRQRATDEAVESNDLRCMLVTRRTQVEVDRVTLITTYVV